MMRCGLRTYTRVLVLPVILAMAACGPMQEAMPEPSEKDRVEKLTRVLGKNNTLMDRLWSEVSGKPLPRADGLVFRDWLRRRKATLEGNIKIDQERADHNPGSVKEALAWERATRIKDRQTRTDLGAYHDVIDKMRPDCPMRIEYENEWFALYEEAYAKGEDKTRVNWTRRHFDLVMPCQAEKNEAAAAATAAAAMLSETVSDTQSAAPASELFVPLTQQEKALVERYLDENSKCRGSSDPKVQGKSCAARDSLLDEMNSNGVCWGREGEASYQQEAHRCAPGSIGWQGWGE